MPGDPIEELLVRLQADAKEYMKTFGNAQKKTQSTFSRINASLKKNAARFLKWGAIVASAATAVGVALIRSSLRQGDALGKLSDRLNISTEALAGLHLAAQLVGTDIAKLNITLGYMARRIGEVTLEGGEFAKTFEELNVNVDELRKMRADEQFITIAEGLSRLDTQAEKVSVAMDIFGRSGASIVNMLILGREGLESIREETVAYGTAISRIDAARIEEANDSVTRTKEATKGMALQATVVLAPALQVISDRLRKITADSDDVRARTRSALDSMISAFGTAVNAVQFLRKTFGALKVGTFALGGGIATLAKTIGHGFVIATRKAEEAAANFGSRLQFIFTGEMKAPDLGKILETRELKTKIEDIQSTFRNAMTNAILDYNEINVTLGTELVENLRISLAKAQEVVDEATADRLAKADAANAAQAGSAGKWLKKELTIRQQFGMAAAGVAVGIMQNIADTMEEGSKKAFHAQQLAAHAGAVINTAAGITKAIAEYPPPLSGIMAGLQFALGATQIAAIKSTTYAGGGTVPSPGGGGAAGGGGIATAGAAGGMAGAGAAPGLDVNVTFEGANVSSEQVRDFIRMLDEQIADGASITSLKAV